MRVTVVVERVYEMDEARILSEPGFAPPSQDASEDEKHRWLRESFYELCGEDRDEDHVDGKYVWLVREDGEHDFEWPRVLAAAGGETTSE